MREETETEELAYPDSDIRGEVKIAYRFWRGASEETIAQTFRGTMREVKRYAAAFTSAVDEAPDWGGGP